MLKKIVCSVLCAVLLLSCMAGCGGSKFELQELPEPITGEGPSYTWDTSPVEISVYIALEGYGYKWNTDILCMGHLTDRTGVTLKLQSGSAERLNGMIASGTLPDIVVLDSIDSPIRNSLEQSGLVWDFDTLTQMYAPDTNIPQSMKTWYAGEDGKLYGYASFFGATEDMEQYPDKVALEYHNKLIVREDLCQKLGISLTDFETQDGFIEALKKVRDAKLTVNGSTLAPLYFMTQPHPLRIAQLFGMPLENEDGTWKEVRFDEKYKEAILFINRMYREGLIPEDAWTATADLVNSKLNNGSVFMLFDKSSSGNMNALSKVDPNASFVAVNPPVSKDGGKPAISAVSTSGWTWLAICKTSKVPDRAIRLVNYLLTEEGQLLNYYGVEGKTFTYNEDGTISYTPEAEALFTTDYNGATRQYGLSVFPWCFNWATYQRFNPEPVTKEAITDKQINDFYREYVYDARCAELVKPAAGSDLLATQTKIDSYWNQQELRMMRATSEEEALQIYEAAVEAIKGMGLEELNAYKSEKFLENKEKIGVKFIYDHEG